MYTILRPLWKTLLQKTAHACILLTLSIWFLQWHTEGIDLYEMHTRSALWQRGQWVYIPKPLSKRQLYVLHWFVCTQACFRFFNHGRVRIQGQRDQWRGEAPLADQRMITTAGDTNMMEVRAFSLTEVAQEITMKISAVTMVKMCISLLIAERVHPQEEWEHTCYSKQCSHSLFVIVAVVIDWAETFILFFLQ